MTQKVRASYLTVPELFRLDACCTSLFHAFGSPPYLVGSTLSRPDYRDVDVRLMLPDDRFGQMFPNQYAHLLLNAAVSDWLRAQTGLPIDFQFQDTTKTNAEHDGPRNPLGIRGQRYMEEGATP